MNLLQTVAHLFHPRRSNNHRARILHPEVIGIFSLLMLAVFTTVSSFPALPGRLGSVLGFASSITPSEVIALTNRQRQQAGLAPLTFNTKLTEAAQAKGRDMMAKQYWAHTSPDGTQPWFFIKNANYNYTVAGENLARDFSDTGEMVQAWMDSPTHRANVLNPRYQDIGIAVIDGNLEGYDTTLVVQMFGTSAGSTVSNGNAQPPSGVSIENLIPIPSKNAGGELTQNPNQQVLADLVISEGELKLPPLFTPVQIIKAVFLALIMMVSFTLIYDSFIIDNRQVIRLVGHNLGHVILFITVAYLLISFKAGILG